MQEVFDIIRDRYTPSEFVEQLDISMDDLLYYLQDYFEASNSLYDNFQDDIEGFYGKDE